MADEKQEPEWQGGELLFCGGTDWALIGRGGGKKKTDAEKKAEAERAEKYPDLNVPHKLKTLTGVKIRFVAAGPAACHCLAADMAGKLFTWGRNERGQLGHGDTLQRNVPTPVAGLEGQVIVAGSGGKFHSAAVTAEGKSFTWGSNACGQLGTGSVKSSPKVEELVKAPTLAQVSDCSQVACGVDFTLWLCGWQLFSAGNPQHGQLGHGTDHEYNAKDSSVKLMYTPQPTPAVIKAFKDTRIVAFACGHNHALALDAERRAWSWGNGGYGRLGHSVQQDEFSPRQISTFSGRTPLDEQSIAACGGTSSFACMVGGALCAWGKLKPTGDSIMYPKPYMELGGWTVRHMACGAATFVCAAHSEDGDSVVTWGAAQHGELGYGAHGKKSSANPDKCQALEGVRAHGVAAGVGHTLFLVEPDHPAVAKLDTFHPEVESEPSRGDADGAEAAAGSGKAKGSGAGAKRKAPASDAGGKKKKPASKGRGK